MGHTGNGPRGSSDDSQRPLAAPVEAVVVCEHDKRFSGVFGLPNGCSGCLACFAEKQASDMRRMEDAFNSMDGLILRIGLLLGHNLPAPEPELSDIFGEWNRIKNAIKDEYGR